jgi:hypothetical protein
MNGTKSCSRTLLRLLLLAVIAPVVAAAAPDSNLQSCASERDDRRRLACYDAEMARLAGEDTAASTEASAATSAPASPPPAEEADAAEDFGMTPALKRSMNANGEEEAKEPDSLAAVVTRIDEKPYGERIVHLDNGQVWEENSRNRNLPLDVGDSVTIKSAVFGSYKLIGPGGKRFTRVRRIG